MAMRQVAVQFGMGTSLRRQDYTEAAARAIRDALWRNSLNAAELFGLPREAMTIEADVGVARPEAVDAEALAAIFPYGRVTVRAIRGGLDVPRPGGEGATVIASAAIRVSFDMEPA